MLGIELCLSLLLALVEGNIEWFGDEDESIHLRHSFSGLLQRAEADKPKALCHSSLIPHDLINRGGDSRMRKILMTTLTHALLTQTLALVS